MAEVPPMPDYLKQCCLRPGDCKWGWIFRCASYERAVNEGMSPQEWWGDGARPSGGDAAITPEERARHFVVGVRDLSDEEKIRALTHEFVAVARTGQPPLEGRRDELLIRLAGVIPCQEHRHATFFARMTALAQCESCWWRRQVIEECIAVLTEGGR